MDRQEYAQHLWGINMAGYTSLILSLGHDLGLFELLMKENRPLTSTQVADIAGMKERYVREWLNAAAVAKMITMDQEKKTFYIPEHHHDTLKLGMITAGGIPLFSGKIDALKNCFKKDGPYSFASFDGKFWPWYNTLRNIQLDEFVDRAIPCYKECGLHDKLESGVDVLDVCCGVGQLITKLAARYPKSKFTGLELNQIPFDRAQDLIASLGLQNCNVIRGNVLDLPDWMVDKYDLVTMEDALHDLPDPHNALTQISKVLKKDGTFTIGEFSFDANTSKHIGNLEVGFLYTCSLFVCLPSGLSEEPRTGYGTCWGRQNVLAALQKEFIVERSFEFKPFTMLDVCKKK